MPDFIGAVEVIYRELAKPKAPEPRPAPVNDAAKNPELTRADVDSILQRKRSATPGQLQDIIAHAKEYKLTPSERNQLSVDLTIQIANARQSNGRENPSDRFIAQVLGYMETPYGLVEREWVDNLLRDGAQSIARCKNRRPPECQCWAASRAILWQASANGEKTPEAWAANRIYEWLGNLEMSSRSECDPGV